LTQPNWLLLDDYLTKLNLDDEWRGQRAQTKLQQKITGSEFFIVHITRAMLNGEKDKTQFDLQLSEDGNFPYQVIGFIVHIGETSNRGHYVAYIKNGDGWICKNDSRSIDIQETYFQSDQFQEEHVTAVLLKKKSNFVSLCFKRN